MINFATLQGMTIPEGVVTQIARDGVVLWKLETNKPVVLEVEKITANTKGSGTTYTGEEFILLDVYPKTNGTVSVTYGGLTKTITDTSGVEEPNAQQVFFGTLYGVSDSVVTPTSGELIIEGDYYAFGCGIFNLSDSKVGGYSLCYCVKTIKSFGSSTLIPQYAFGYTTGTRCPLTSVTIPSGITSIGDRAFCGCMELTSVTIGKDVTSIETSAFTFCTSLNSVSFGNTVGWYVTETEGGDISTGTPIDVSDTTNNATLLVSTHTGKYWYRK